MKVSCTRLKKSSFNAGVSLLWRRNFRPQVCSNAKMQYIRTVFFHFVTAKGRLWSL